MKNKKTTLRHIYRWIRLLSGRSYYHQPQNLGKYFVPGKAKGYFNDLTQKAVWVGEVDENNIPVNRVLEKNTLVYFTTTIVQKALGHYDTWLQTQHTKDFFEFIKLCDWLVDNQDSLGGWDVWHQMGVNSLTPYSAMTQGEVTSAMVRAWNVTKKNSYRACARHALNLMLLPISNGGTTFYENEDIYLEEVPIKSRNTILNGWVFAMMGLYDYYSAFEDKKIYVIFMQTLNTLEKEIHHYDAGYWSFYDTIGHLASHIYHNLHIAQLTALLLIAPEYKEIRRHRDRWKQYQKRVTNYVRALLVKGIQKIKDPGEVTLIK